MGQIRSALDPSLFVDIPYGEHWGRAIGILYDYVDQHRVPISSAVFDAVVQGLIEMRPARDRESWVGAWAHIRHTLFDAPAHDMAFVKEHALSWAQDQKLKLVVLGLRDDINKGVAPDVGQYIEELKQVSKLSPVSLSGQDLFRDVQQTMNLAMSNQLRPVVPLGIASLDKVLEGGVGRGEMLTIAGPPNRGKSSVLAAIGASLIKTGKKLVHVTLEQSRELIFQKLLANLTNVDPKEFLYNTEHIRNTLEFIRNRCNPRVALEEYPSRKFTVDDLANTLLQIESHWGERPDALIVDYPGLMAPTRVRGDNRTLELGEIYTDLRSIALEFKIAIITAAQINRAGAGKSVSRMEDLAQAYEIAWVSDALITLNQSEEEYRAGRMRMFIAKNRIGEKMVDIPFRIKFNLAQLEEAENAAGGRTSMIQMSSDQTNQIMNMFAPGGPRNPNA